MHNAIVADLSHSPGHGVSRVKTERGEEWVVKMPVPDHYAVVKMDDGKYEDLNIMNVTKSICTNVY